MGIFIDYKAVHLWSIAVAVENQKRTEGIRRRFYFVKRPVFDREKNIWGYELFRKDCPKSAFSNATGRYDEEISPGEGGCDNLSTIVEKDRNVIMDICDRNILTRTAQAADPARVILKIQEKLYSSSSILSAQERLRGEGYRVALVPSPSCDDCAQFAALTDIVYVDVFDFRESELEEMARKATAAGLPALAGQVAGKGHQEDLARMGFTLFSGPFYKEPEIIAGKRLSSGETARFNLFKIIERDEPDFDELAETLQTDVALTLRLFAFLNSAFFGFPTKIKSIHQAVTMLGWDKVRSWLRIMLMEDLTQDRNVPEMLVLSVQRGKFLEVLAKECEELPDSGVLSLLGTFSCLDTILQMPLSAIVPHLPLEEELKKALLGEPGNPYLSLIKLAACVEEPDWPAIDPILEECGLEFDTVALAVFVSSQWVERFFHSRAQREREREQV